VQSAFRRAALRSHPDKAAAAAASLSSTQVHFVVLVGARDAALAWIERRDVRREQMRAWFGGDGGSEKADDGRGKGRRHRVHTKRSQQQQSQEQPQEAQEQEEEQEQGQDAPAQSRAALFAWVAATALRCTEAKPVVVSIDATLADIYDARKKRVVVQVLRAPDLFRRTRQVLMVPLALPSATLAVDAAPVVFPGMGDDSVADILLGRALSGRGEVRVHVRVLVDPEGAFSMDTVLRPCDLHATVPISLHARYYGEQVTVVLPGSDGPVVRAVFDPKGPDRQVRVIKGRGMPYGGGDGGGGRGDLYVFMETRLPTLDAERLADPAIRRFIRDFK
jgi:hypothetical protein